MKYLTLLLILLLLGGCVWGEEIKLNSDETKLWDTAEIDMWKTSTATNMTFGGGKYQWIIDAKALSEMTACEIDSLAVAIRLFTSGAFFSDDMITAICERFLPDRYKKEQEPQ